MGQTISSFTKGTEQSENNNKEETIDQLQLIQQMLATKIGTETNKMRVAASEDKRFPVATVVGTLEKHLIATQRATVAEIEKCLSEAFRTEFVDGLIKMALADVNEILEKTSESEAETMASHVVFANNSVLRVDYYLYKYTFCSKGLRDKFKNTVCYAVQLGVLDLEKADLELVIQGLEKTFPNLEYRKQRQNFHQELLRMRDFYREITRLQQVLARKEKKSDTSWENILCHLLLLTDFQQNRQTPTKTFRLSKEMERNNTPKKETEVRVDQCCSETLEEIPDTQSQVSVSSPQTFYDTEKGERKKARGDIENLVSEGQTTDMEGQRLRSRRKFNSVEFRLLKFLFLKPFHS